MVREIFKRSADGLIISILAMVNSIKKGPKYFHLSGVRFGFKHYEAVLESWKTNKPFL